MDSAPPAVTNKPPPLTELVTALKPIVRKGLPVTPGVADDKLLALRGVWARSIDPDDRLYRVRGLDRLLRELLVDYPDDEGLALAARILFAVEPGSRGSTLTQRRERVAREVGYDVDHVRKAIQPKVVEQLAWMIHLDSQTYTPRGRGVPPPIAISGDTPQIASEDLQTEERLEHEVARSQLWALVYALRADVLTVERFKRYPPPEGAVEMLAKARERRDALDTELGSWIEAYIERWGARIGHGEAGFDARRLKRLAAGI